MSEQTDFLTEFLSKNSFSSLFEDKASTEPPLRADELAKVTEYLESPTNNGYWRLSGCWLPGGKFSRFISEKILEKYPEAEAKNNRKLTLDRARLERNFIK